MLQNVEYLKYLGQICWLQRLLHEMLLTVNLNGEDSFMGHLFYIDEYSLLLIYVYQIK